MGALWVGLGLAVLWAGAEASALSRRQPSGTLRAKRELAALSPRLKRQLDTSYTYETSESSGGSTGDGSFTYSTGAVEYEYTPGGYEYSTVYEDLSGTAYYWWSNAAGKKTKKLRKLAAGFYWWTNAAGVKVKKKKVSKTIIKKKKLLKKKKKKLLKKKKKVLKKKKVVVTKVVVTTPAPTTTTTPKPPPPPPPAPVCPDPTPNYEYIPIMEYVSQPRVESVPVYEERIVPDWSAAGRAQTWNYARPLAASAATIIPQQGQTRRYFMMRRRDGSDGLGQMGLGQLQSFLQNQISYSSLNGGTRVIPASSWNSGLSRTIRGGSNFGSSMGSMGSMGSSMGSIGGSSLGTSFRSAPTLPGYQQGSSSGAFYVGGQQPRNAYGAGTNFGTSYNWGSRSLNKNNKKKH